MICMHIVSFVCVKFMKFNHVSDSKISVLSLCSECVFLNAPLVFWMSIVSVG